MNTKKLALVSLMISLSLVLSFVERLLPSFTPVPGIKLGLANIVVVFALYKAGWKEAFVITVLRVLISSLLFGTFLSLAYSMAGAVVSFLIMALLKRTAFFSTVAVSIVGGIVHNLAQIVVASLILGSNLLVYYAPVLIISGTVAGVVIGLVSSVLIRRIELE